MTHVEQCKIDAAQMNPLDFHDPEAFESIRDLTLAASLARLYPDDAVLQRNLANMEKQKQKQRSAISQNELLPQKAPAIEQSDLQRAFEFSEQYRESICFAKERGVFMVYDGKRWETDKGDIVVKSKAQEFVDTLTLREIEIKDYKERSSFHNSVIKPWLKFSTRKTAIEDSKPMLARSVKDFDANIYQFNVLNCTLQFCPDTGAVQKLAHEPTQYITRIADVEYRPDCTLKRWEQFINEITQGDESLSLYLQKAMGYSLTGDTCEESFFILWGKTARNGKSTLLETVRGIFSEYSASCDAASLTSRENYDGSKPREDVARLAGVRFVTVSEPPKNMQLDAVTVKTWTGGDSIPARFLHENSFEFIPQFCLFLNTNHLPAVNDMTVFSSGRLRVIPFMRHFAENERDKTLKHQFATPKAKSAILNWLIEGYKMYITEGLEPPQIVKDVTATFKRDSDKLGQFVDECFVPNVNGEIRTADAYEAYRIWATENGYRPLSQRTFKADIGAHADIEKRRPKNGGGATPMMLGFEFNDEGKNKPPF
jgi:putative DNA primase/helicase